MEQSKGMELRHFSASAPASTAGREAVCVGCGADLVVVVGGGARYHVGAVALGLSLPSLKDPARRTCSGYLVPVPGHKEEDLARESSLRLSRALERNVVVTVGGSAQATSGVMPQTNMPQVVVLGSNTRFLGTVSGEEKNRKVTFDLISNPKGGPGPFSLPVTIEYDSYNGGRGSVTQSVGLMLNRTLVFDVGQLTYPREATVSVPFKTSVTVQNTNEFPVNGVALTFSGMGVSWSSNETTVGTLDPGKSGKLEAVGIPQQAGPVVLTMVITYKDDYNQVKEIRRDITLQVKPKPVVVTKASAFPARPATTGGLVAMFLKALLGVGG
jgi:hypothetical protein